MTPLESLCKKATSIYFIVAFISDQNVKTITAKPQSNPCLVLKLPLCSINPNFANGGGAGSRPVVEQPRRQQGNKLKSSPQNVSPSLSAQDLAVSSLLDKFLKST